ncbi:mechanosensitive ion channel [Halostella sp. JP-L12]|uniref:mechanosensitive ion channel domain-containing protein n=1 Tax=Halostella TaxID=1843185 RepID=UPI000EF84E59|nr:MULTISPECIES: mechanosensitive ion channel domain-containing protein [Halostella]NHN48829.1 mechanosensitive ion channel [Halostella sp. JP-L12]
MVQWSLFTDQPAALAAAVLALGILLGYLIGKLNKRLLTAAGVPDAVEGTPFERTAQSIGTSTVTIVARLSSWFVYGVAVLTAIHIAELVNAETFWLRVTQFVPQLFIAALVLIVGFVIADKAQLVVSERLRGIKLPEVSLLPKVIKYSVLYIASLVALGQIGVNTTALNVLLTVYVFGLVFLGGLAFKDFLASGAAGIYLLLNQPYGIGDSVRIGDHQGIVQEVDVFVTHIENDEEEFIVPNSRVLDQGIVRVRN